MAEERTFQYVGGSSRKFWRIKQQGKSFVVRFGRLDTAGSEVAKKFANEASARREAARLIAEKLRKGYVEIRTGKAGKSPVAAPAKVPSGRAQTPGKRWNELAALHPPRSPQRNVSKAFLAQVAKAFGLKRLPPSYVEFVLRFRHEGERDRTGPNRRFPRSINILVEPARLKADRELYALRLDSMAKFDEAAALKAAQLRPLIPFGADGAGLTICWDPAQADANGELMICAVETGDYMQPLSKARRDLVSDLFELYRHYRP